MLAGYAPMYDMLSDAGMPAWSESLSAQLHDYFVHIKHGDFQGWLAALDALPVIKPDRVELDAPVVRIDKQSDMDETSRKVIRDQLRCLMPWRKGPFNWFGVEVDAEWRSDLKWSRFADAIAPLQGRTVLDIGCGNGYYGWRMLGQQARLVVGTDPTLRFVMQFHAAKKYLQDNPHFVLPFALEDLQYESLNFDTVFSMGVIYHRRDPHDHLQRIFHCLRSGGEVLLEGLVVENGVTELLRPEGRYAKMNNVRHIPSCKTLESWLRDSGFVDIRTVDVTVTTTREQRATEWMEFESLSDFLDPDNPDKTVEGYPAPVRAILLAEKP